MVLEGIVHIDPPEPRDSLAQLMSGEEPEEMIVFNLLFEGEFGAWKNANRDIRLVRAFLVKRFKSIFSALHLLPILWFGRAAGILPPRP